MNLDPDLPEVGRLAWLAKRLNRINAQLRSLQPVNSPDILTGHTALGVTHRLKAVSKSATSGEDDGARWA